MVQFKERTTIDTEEAARAYGISRETAYQQAEALGALRIGRRIVFPVAKVASDLGITSEELLRRCATTNGNNGANGH